MCHVDTVRHLRVREATFSLRGILGLGSSVFPSLILASSGRNHACFVFESLFKRSNADVPVSNSWSLLIGLVVIVALSAGAYFLSPKGENQTYVDIPYPFLADLLVWPPSWATFQASWLGDRMAGWN